MSRKRVHWWPWGARLSPCDHMWRHLRNHTGQLSGAAGEGRILAAMPVPFLWSQAVLTRIPGSVHVEGGDGPVLQGHGG